MQYQELLDLLRHSGMDPARLIFEDELTGISNRRFLQNYLKHKVRWADRDECVLSLIMTDLDGFKQLNDRFGHQFGDRALIWFAEQLKQVVGDEGLPVRNSGDEFMVLMPGCTKSQARSMAERLLQRFRDEPFNSREGELKLRLSIGVASAPDDAQDAESLIHMADTALYCAKNAGGNRIAVTDESEVREVFGSTGLNQARGVEVVGREAQLERVADGLDRLTLRESSFLLVEGAAGMGKSTFLETIRRKLSRNPLGQVVKVRGRREELFRPYYLTTDILVALLNQRPDQGLAVFDDLSPEELAYASHILPQLAQEGADESEQDEKLRREQIFNTFVRLIAKALESRPLILLIDDLHFIDYATLNLLRVLATRDEAPVFVCGTFMDSLPAKTEEQMTPLQRFLSSRRNELEIEEIKLTPLSPPNISTYIQTLFPAVRMPKDFEHELAQIIQGNPLFLGEILRKLVRDQKITLVGQQWVIRQMTSDELPSSLEEIVTEKLAALDEEARQLLAHASVFGEDVNLSALAASSENMEARVLEFVDRAADLGLLSSEFQLNDETIHFISKRVLEIIYGKIQAPRKQELHERVGTYQEGLYEKKLLPSASILAYHFKRSTRQEKARTYEQLQRAQNTYVFNAREAVHYSGDEQANETAVGPPLTEASRVHLPAVLRWLQTAVNNVKLYPSESAAIANGIQRLKGAIDEVLAENEQLHLHREDHELMVNGEPLELVGCEFVIEGVFGMLRRMELVGIAFHRGLEERELHALIDTLGHAQPEEVNAGFWLRFSAKHRVPHINLRQLRYTEVAEEAGAAAAGRAAGAPGAATAEAQAIAVTESQSFDPQERDWICEVMRGLLGVARGIRLYPLKSKAVSAGIEHLLQALRKILGQRRELTLAAAGEALLVDGVRLSGAGVERLANSFVGFLASIKLSGLTFTESISVQEIESFIGAMRQFSNEGGDGTFWERLAAEEGISSIRFGQNLYKVGELPTLLLLEEEAPAEPAESLPEPEDPTSEAEFAALLETLPERVVKLLLEEETSEIEVLLDYLFNGFERRSVLNRKQAVEACRSSLKTLSPGFQYEFAKLMAEPLLTAFVSEEQPGVVREMGGLLQRMAGISIQFSAYALACRILSQLHGTYHQYQAAEDPRAESLAEHLDRQMEPATHELLVEDLSSTDPVRQRAAARVLAYVGRVAVPLLIDVVKGATEGRARQIAGGLLAEVAEEAGVLLKRTLAQETDVGQVVRILDVIDTVTRDVNTELARALTDNSAEVRQAALRLAERLNDSQVVELLLEHARGPETELATSVIRWFGRIKAKGVVQEIVSMLTSTHEPARIIACCHALGQSADPVAIEPLATLLSARLALRRRRKWSSEVRAAAALALAKMGHADALAVLEGFTQDKDRAVQRVAQNASISKASSLPPR